MVWFEELTQNQERVYPAICRFLGIDDMPELVASPVHANSRDVKRKQVAATGQSIEDFDTQWDDETRAFVIDKLREDNLKILRYFDKPDDYWGDLFDTDK